MLRPFVTPKKIFGAKKLPYPCDIAIICFCPMPKQFETYGPKKCSERLFLHVHPEHIRICEQRNFIVIAEVYGGPVSVSVVEELHNYGVTNVIGLGFVGSLTNDLPMGSNFCSGDSLMEEGTCPHYTIVPKDEYIKCDININAILNTKLKSHNIWTTNAIYREYDSCVHHAKNLGCDAVNMDTAPLFAVCQKLKMPYCYVATVSDVLNHTWENDLTASVDNGNTAQDELVKIIVGFIPEINTLSKTNYDKIEVDVADAVEKLFIELNICKSHSIDHIKRVLRHTKNALIHELASDKVKFLISLASILHDVDDTKFTCTESYSNAKKIMADKLCEEDIDMVVEMISYVSASANGNRIPPRARIFPWLLIPRYADRLEAAGTIGVIRCYQFAKTKSMQLYSDATPKPCIIDDVWDIATEERYVKYNGQSATMIDHYYDKLLRIGKFDTNNSYLQEMQSFSLDPLLQVIQLFIDGELTDQYFENLIQD